MPVLGAYISVKDLAAAYKILDKMRTANCEPEIDFMFNAKVTEPTPQELINLHPHETSFYKHSSRSSVSSPTSRRSKRTSRKKISDCFEVGRPNA